MKKLTSIIGLLAIGVAAYSADSVRFYGPGTPVINSASTTATNLTFGANTNGIWPCYIPASTSFTNVTAFPVSNGKLASIEFNVASSQASASNVVWQIGRSVSGNSPTNSTATGAKIEWFATYTNTLPNVANQVATGIAQFGEPSSSGIVNYGDGACTTFYIGWVTTPALTTLTNYSVYVNCQ